MVILFCLDRKSGVEWDKIKWLNYNFFFKTSEIVRESSQPSLMVQNLFFYELQIRRIGGVNSSIKYFDNLNNYFFFLTLRKL